MTDAVCSTQISIKANENVMNQCDDIRDRCNQMNVHFLHIDTACILRSLVNPIGLYRDVWNAAIASSRKSRMTLSVVMCNMSQCRLRSLRVNSGMGNVMCIVT